MSDKSTENDQHKIMEQGTFEILQKRLNTHADDLNQRLEQLNEERKNIFGTIENRLIGNERITTSNNCISRDMIALKGGAFLFGYNVRMGLKSETTIEDVLSIYAYDNTKHQFHKVGIELLKNEEFVSDFQNLQKYYKEAEFSKFAKKGDFLYMIFQIGKSANDIKVFKWDLSKEPLQYVDNRSHHEISFQSKMDFDWKRTSRDEHRLGQHPHISIEDIVFVETVQGDLTIKIEDNTETGKGIYSEPVLNRDQSLDDAEVYYSKFGNLILLKIRPYQENDYRFMIFNNKIKTVQRIDAISNSCILLPEDHGIIFPQGYYIQTGEFKVFESHSADAIFEKRIASPNGEDFLYVFYDIKTGIYLLLSYNIIEQEISTPITCHGYSIFDDGELIYFKSEDEPKKNHSIQIWSTPYYHHDKVVEGDRDSILYKVGNKEIVQVISECKELIKLLSRGVSYENLYLDLTNRSSELLDGYYWLNEKKMMQLEVPISQIKESSGKAIDEFEKVVEIRKNTSDRCAEIFGLVKVTLEKSKVIRDHEIMDYVEMLGALRSRRGEVESLRELRYAPLEELGEKEISLSKALDEVARKCVGFLLQKKSLQPYLKKVESLELSVQECQKVIDARTLQKEVSETAAQLDLLIEIVSNLKIEDATQSTEIIENISKVYALFNKVSASLKNKIKQLADVEGEAEFKAQLRLIAQSIVNYLDISDEPEKCEEYLNKLMVQLEELEAKFSESEKYLDQISEKREEVYNAFESRKIALIEKRNQQANALVKSAERILSSIQHKLTTFSASKEINGFFATDLMVEKVRDISTKLVELKDTIKADDIASRLKSLKDESFRQLNDRQELFADGDHIVKFGKHKFFVNTKNVDLVIVLKDELPHFHITGTGFFQEIKNDQFEQLAEYWNQQIVSENKNVYRSEYLASKIFNQLNGAESAIDRRDILIKEVNKSYSEGYTKGVHDEDAIVLLEAMVKCRKEAGRLTFKSKVRTEAILFWLDLEKEEKDNLLVQLKAVRSIQKAFPTSAPFPDLLQRIQEIFNLQATSRDSISSSEKLELAQYLYHTLIEESSFITRKVAFDLATKFKEFLHNAKLQANFLNSVDTIKESKHGKFKIIEKWLLAFTKDQEVADDVLGETAIYLLEEDLFQVEDLQLSWEISELKGDHRTIENGLYTFDWQKLKDKLDLFQNEVVPNYLLFQEVKHKLVKEYKGDLHLESFKPKVMSSFVRNRLIDEVYLPLIGDNLAKQIGVAGKDKRTDLMGLLLLISPPGYGKTTLMEYIANRLGVVFMKINGPALGHEITSVDPDQAKGAAAKDELRKLNLAFEMGDNVMIYLDDIQHCNPEFLQKFISLCDGQRKIEGVFQGKAKSYDFRGKKVAVVMAGNPYTESGDKFKIPDMLSNRADIYNLGDMAGVNESAFYQSYIENALTSQKELSLLASKPKNDIREILKLAETDDYENFQPESNFSQHELNDWVSLLKKVIVIRNVVLKVNESYIHSASQEDQYRVEPSFLLQGSYRNMNKMVEKIQSIMNDKELKQVISTHYEHESQTLATGAESNMLKFLDITENIEENELKRWLEIKNAFCKFQKIKNGGGNAQMSLLVDQVENIAESMGNIEGKEVLSALLKQMEEISSGLKTFTKHIIENQNQN